MELLRHPERALPNAETATAADAKFTGYLFNPKNARGWHKGIAFTERLGYNKENWEQLQKEILSSASKYPTVFKGSNAYGNRYEQRVVLQGRKHKPANVILGWLTDKDGTHLTTAHIKEV